MIDVNGLVQSSVRVLSVPIWISYAKAIANGYHGIDATTFFGLLYSTDEGTAFPQTLAVDAIFTGLRINRTISTLQIKLNLLDQTVNYSLTSPVGLANLWVPSYLGRLLYSNPAANCAVVGAALGAGAGTLCNQLINDGGAFDDIRNIVSWMNDALSPTRANYTYWDATIAPVTDKTLFNCTDPSVYNLTGHTDFGYCQLGQGRLSLINYGTKSLSPPPGVGVPSAIASAACGSFAQRGLGCVGPEYYAYSNGTSILTVPEAKALYNIDSTTYNGFNIAFGALDYATATSDSHLAVVDATINAGGAPFGIDAARRTTVRGYLYSYLAQNYAAPSLFIDDPSTGQKRSGIFANRPPAEIMFGYTPPWKYGDNQTARTLSPNNDPLLRQVGQEYWPGLLSNWSSQDYHYLNSKHGYYQVYTGDDNINMGSKYKQWRSASQFNGTDAFAFMRADCLCSYNGLQMIPNLGNSFPWSPACVNDTIYHTISCTQHCQQVWDKNEIIDGSSDGRSSQPFQYKDSDRLTDFFVFSSEAMRVLNLKYSGQDVSVKGIKCRRYILPEAALESANENPANANYHMGDPSGAVDLHWWFGNVPVVLSRPFFWGGDKLLDLSINGSNSMHTVVSLSQYDDPTSNPYDTYVDIEPTTGLTMRAHKRLQYVVKFSASQFNNKYWSNMFAHSFNATPSVIYWPAFWADENGIIKDQDAVDFSNGIFFSRVLAERLESGGLAIGSFFILAGFAGIAFWATKADTTLQKVDSKSAYAA